MRKLRRAEKKSLPDETIAIKKLAQKYFTTVEITDSFLEMKTKLKIELKKLINKKTEKHIKSAINNRFINFGSNIKKNLNQILNEEKAVIDTSFVRSEDEFIIHPATVRDEFYQYYKKLFGNEDIPQLDEGLWIDEYNISAEISSYEFDSVLKKTANNKASGISGLIVEMVKNGGIKLKEWILQQFNT